MQQPLCEMERTRLMIAKNQSYEVRIEDLTLEGSGVCRIEGFAVFVPMTAPGDVARIKIVKVLKSYGFGILEELMEPSPDRGTDPCGGCGVFRRCGGCAFRHITYEAELRLKDKAVRDAFRRLGRFSVDPLPILGAVSYTHLYRKMYLLLFHAVTDALESLEQQRDKLIRIQQMAEEIYISSEEIVLDFPESNSKEKGC